MRKLNPKKSPLLASNSVSALFILHVVKTTDFISFPREDICFSQQLSLSSGTHNIPSFHLDHQSVLFRPTEDRFSLPGPKVLLVWAIVIVCHQLYLTFSKIFSKTTNFNHDLLMIPRVKCTN